MVARVRLCLACVILSLIACILIGCAQNTDATSPQRTDQVMQVPTTTAQDLMTAGSDVRVYIINAPAAPGLPYDDAELEALIESQNGAAGSVPKVNAGYAQAGINVNITTGGTTPSATGSTTGTASSAQTPSQNQTVSPVQDIKPEVTAAAPITVGLPGSATSGTANVAGSGGQLSDPVTSPMQTPTWTQLQVPTNYAADAIAFLKEFLAIKAAGGTPVVTSQPE